MSLDPVTPSVYIALFDYDEKRADEDLSFKKGEILSVIEDQDSDWWLVHSLNSGKKGYIPSNYVTVYRHDDDLQHQDWYFGAISRAEATRLLQRSLCGSFLIRDSESIPGGYSLGVHDRAKVRFYLIRQCDEGFFITRLIVFKTLKYLVEYYKITADGLCCSLYSACTKKKPQISLSYKMQLMLEIPRESITLVDEGHSGQFGELCKGLWNKTVPVAVRVVETGMVLPLALIEEADILKKLNHPKLVKLYGVCIKDGPMYIITEFMPKGSLLKYLQSSEGRTLELPQLTVMAAQIATGMAYLEMNRYVHCSLAARSVLVSNDNECKVADYGLFELIKDDKRDFPIKWTAPEVVRWNRFSTKSDVWSFGILLYELVTYGKEPYPGMTNGEVLAQVEKGYRMPVPHNAPKHLYDIMLNCWKTKPADRLTFDALRQRMESF